MPINYLCKHDRLEWIDGIWLSKGGSCQQLVILSDVLILEAGLVKSVKNLPWDYLEFQSLFHPEHQTLTNIEYPHITSHYVMSVMCVWGPFFFNNHFIEPVKALIKLQIRVNIRVKYKMSNTNCFSNMRTVFNLWYNGLETETRKTNFLLQWNTIE